MSRHRDTPTAACSRATTTTAGATCHHTCDGRLAKKFEAGSAAAAAAAKAGKKDAALAAYATAADTLSQYLTGCELEPLGDAYYAL
jgi:hypothetical protein